MTTVIDHAIQVPATPSFIWHRIGNLENNPAWQANCKAVAYLTGTHKGVGTRWRSRASDGRDMVLEITAWYENMGYEYKVIDGGQFIQGRGRLRLQEIAEGTVVQWTLTYETAGLMSSLRNSLSLRRQVDNQIAESLRKLYRLIKEQGGKIDMENVKSLMRDAPAYEQRLEYKPRYLSAFEADRDKKITVDRSDLSAVPFLQSADLLPSVTTFEEDDTRPNPVVRVSDTTIPPMTHSGELSASIEPLAGVEPSFLSAISPMPRRDDSEQVAAFARPTPPTIPMPAMPEVPRGYPPPVSISPGQTRPIDTESPHSESPISAALETREVSVFDLFGVPRPSKTQEMRAVTSEETALKSSQSVSAPTKDYALRSGYRLRARRQFPRLRRPSTK